MEKHEDVQYCFQDRNSSCRKALLSTSIYITLYIFFSLISAVTVFLNVLVIISISHFKQLHTPTNLLILSLAVADLLVGLIVIPVTTVAIMESCWDFGKYFCVFHVYITCLCTSLSLGNLVLISIDCYVAVCDPLLSQARKVFSKEAAIDNFLSYFNTFLPLVNSLINPIIYAFFYPWFKVTAKLLLTLKIRRS
ncbi:trace amine-associated receptor 7h-like [Salmo trutta]|uniref:trace amine-associated receptor 7h-like n=1 Tax=Salmo trutta TaxID=8032 RepID=UPI001131A5ED|nr:trace amine-associated receptor 7h-like [Salmo trutta]